MDRVSSSKRSFVMASIKSRGSKLEILLKRQLAMNELTSFEFQPTDIIGKPDFADTSKKIAIFIDSCFWHGCKKHLRLPATNQEYWITKVQRNRTRDKVVNKKLSEEGWLVVRIWEHSINKPRTNKWWLTRIKTLANKR